MQKFTMLNEQRRPDNQLLTTTTETDESDIVKSCRAFIGGSRSIPDINAAVTLLSDVLPETPFYQRVKTDYTYYANGDVDEIVVTQLDSLDNPLSTTVIKHYQDGRQPHIV